MGDSVEALFAFCQENRRVCPMPQQWDHLWQILPNRQRTGAGQWLPSLPLILGAWDAPAMLKTLRLREHIKHAAQHGSLETVSNYLRGLPEEQWFHLGD